jgi:Glycosyltransferase Family 4
VELLLGTSSLAGFGGAETYLVTLAEQLQRLGHEVTVHTLEGGETADFARGRGLRVAMRNDDLPGVCDAMVVQDGITSFTLAERYPTAPQVFVAHAAATDLVRPPQLAGVVSAVVVLNDRIAHRLRATALDHELVRLRQPVDLGRFSPRGSIRLPPRRALLLSNHLQGPAREMLVAVCAEAGVSVTQLGRHGKTSATPELDISDADIVIGYGRSIVEAIAAGRPAYVFDHAGGDGWVTAESYPGLEADGFAGTATGAVIDAARLRADLAAYSPDMGLVNRQLAWAHHDAMEHAADIAALLKRLAPVDRDVGGGHLREMARLVRLQAQIDGRAAAFADENRRLRDQLEVERARREQESGTSQPDGAALRRAPNRERARPTAPVTSTASGTRRSSAR